MIYLDYNATSPLDPRVLEAMLPWFSEKFGNAASRPHRFGAEARDAVESARAEAARQIGAEPEEIVWTSGATESDNLALKGVAAAAPQDRNHLVTVATEHRAVLDPCERLEGAGFKVSVLGVEPDGSLRLDQLERAVTDRTLLVSIMHANNETGVLHPLAEIGKICRAKGAYFHTDATQSYGKEPLDVNSVGIDLLSASAHKFCGPKGVGLLYIRKRGPRVRCEQLFHGGGHERGFRSGTLNVPGIVGFGTAAAICRKVCVEEQPRIRGLRDRFEEALRAGLDGVETNGTSERRLAGTTNLSFERVDGDLLMKNLPDLALSSSAACTSARLQPSYVLGAMGSSEERIKGSLRFSIGRFTTSEELLNAARALTEEIRRQRNAPRS
ncbi:MAG TPA: cysteine desulfurase family protein [Planctomycetota bacterium]|jgi:cysteine desulfurase|nr:cysteine desulfurase family protein [Planctomycetota bacterium]